MLRMRDDLIVMTIQEFFQAELTDASAKDFIDVEQELELLETLGKMDKSMATLSHVVNSNK